MEMTAKKTYETPEAEMMMFNYRDQVVVASSGNCPSVWVNIGNVVCTEGNGHHEYLS